ncbi:MAG: sulfur carrier protein ThiS [Pseudomonadota bacterium]
MIDLYLNGEAISTDAENLAALLQDCGYEHDRLATALNGIFVHRESRTSARLSPGDRVEVVSPIEGG